MSDGRTPMGHVTEASQAVMADAELRAARLVEDGTIIRSGGEGEAYARRVENLLKREARDTLLERTDHHLRALGQGPVKMGIADTRSRWGSCSPHNRTIRYSWRVIMAPPPVIDYLAAHEVAHLVHADHSPAAPAWEPSTLSAPR